MNQIGPKHFVDPKAADLLHFPHVSCVLNLPHISRAAPATAASLLHEGHGVPQYAPPHHDHSPRFVQIMPSLLPSAFPCDNVPRHIRPNHSNGQDVVESSNESLHCALPGWGRQLGCELDRGNPHSSKDQAVGRLEEEEEPRVVERYQGVANLPPVPHMQGSARKM